VPDRSRHIHAGLRVSAVSIVWTVLASTVSVVLGVRAGSLVLIAFGAVGIFDAIGSAVLVSHFRHALKHDNFSEHRERVAQRVVAAGLLIVGTATLVASAIRLNDHAHAKAPIAGLVVSGASVVVLTSLATRKRRLGALIPSRALQADGGLSFVGALTAVAALAGASLNSALGWWWMDPSAACAIAVGALALAGVTARAAFRT
jgi:divalent metal cation (Fe/Co/Zn/Cd) transporter